MYKPLDGELFCLWEETKVSWQPAFSAVEADSGAPVCLYAGGSRYIDGWPCVFLPGFCL